MKDGKSSKDKGYSLRDWFKGGGWKQTGGKYDGKPCAKQPGQTTKPYCRDPDDRAAMSKDERNKRAAKKRREDPNPDRTGKAKIVTQEETKKDACYKKVKASAKVWPSAYASGRLVQCRKKGAANWGNKSESYEFSNWRDDFQATEYEFVDIIKPEPITGSQQIDEKCWDGYTQQGMKKKGKKVVPNCVPVGEEKHTPTKSDLEANIGGGNLQKLSKKASKRIDYDVDGEVDSQDKVEKSKGEYGEELPTPFGKFRTGNAKKVKVKKEEFFDWREELSEASVKKYCPKCKKVETKSQCAYGPKYWEDNAEEVESGDMSEGAAWTKKSGKSESGGLNEKGRKSYERENPGSDLKAPSKKVGNPRRKSFCARMKGMKKKLTSSKTANDPDSRINKSLRAWNC
jgi:hypothetical protein